MCIDGVARARCPEHSAKRLRDRVGEVHDLRVAKKEGHGNLRSGAATPDLGHYPCRGHEWRPVLVESTREMNHHPVSALERDEGSGVENDARGWGHAAFLRLAPFDNLFMRASARRISAGLGRTLR